MLRHLIRALPLLACVHSGSVYAQSGDPFGPLSPPGPSAMSSPLLDRYTLQFLLPDPLATSRIVDSLDRVQQIEPPLRLRGAKEVELFRELSPSVTLVLRGDGSGSGSLLSIKAATGSTPRTGVILTNWHVVAGDKEVGIVFKPREEGQTISAASILRGQVRKADRARDLALVEVAGVPPNAMPIELGNMNEVQVGADVHAIGHPSGETWTYTKGLISQIRLQYEWQVEPALKHKADVIQTQTPINPGNSGGPLISDSGRLIGVNSFKAKGEALNFAVSVGEVRKFLAAAAAGAFDPEVTRAAARACDWKVTYEGRTKGNEAYIKNVNMDCTGRVKATLYVPDNKSKPIEFRIDSNEDGKVDAVIVDTDRDGKWDSSLWDTDFDGKPDLIGYHPDGELKPSRLEKYRAKS